MNHDSIGVFRSAIEQAREQRSQLVISGANSKAFYGNPVSATVLSTLEYQGVLRYEPSELFITAKSGTPLREIEHILAEKHQQLAFEPPRFSEHGGTIGGMVACGLSGPARAVNGTVRDYLLGCKLMNGKGEVMRFGGEVMKNVAGYDVARMMAGSLGSLALLLEVSLKVLPQPKAELTLVFDMPEDQALLSMNRWAGKPLPISATWWYAQRLSIRLTGAESTLKQSVRDLGGQVVDESASKMLWQSIRDQTHEFFNLHSQEWLWRIQVPSTCNAFTSQALECNGHLRWLNSPANQTHTRQIVAEHGGQTTLYRAPVKPEHVFTPLPPAIAQIQARLRQSFDPDKIFAAERLFSRHELGL